MIAAISPSSSSGRKSSAKGSDEFREYLSVILFGPISSKSELGVTFLTSGLVDRGPKRASTALTLRIGLELAKPLWTLVLVERQYLGAEGSLKILSTSESLEELAFDEVRLRFWRRGARICWNGGGSSENSNDCLLRANTGSLLPSEWRNLFCSLSGKEDLLLSISEMLESQDILLKMWPWARLWGLRRCGWKSGSECTLLSSDV